MAPEFKRRPVRLFKIVKFPLFCGCVAGFNKGVHDNSIVVGEARDGGDVFNEGGVCDKNKVEDVVLTGGFFL